MDSFGVILFIAFHGMFVVFAFIFLGIPFLRRRRFKAYCQQLESTGFFISKRITTSDFYKFGYGWKNPFVGIWIDYDSSKLAIRASADETIPKIYSFSDVKSVDLKVGEARLDTFKTSTAPWARQKTIMLAGEIDMRITLSDGGRGVKSIQLPLWKTTFIGGKEDVNSRGYQSILNGAENMASELNHIIENLQHSSDATEKIMRSNAPLPEFDDERPSSQNTSSSATQASGQPSPRPTKAL